VLSGRLRRRSWLLWAAQPWRSPAVAIALVGALGLPALLLSSGPLFERSASDAIATDLVAELAPGPAGLMVSAVVGLREPGLGELSSLVEARLREIDALGAPLRTAMTDPLTAARDGDEGDGRRIARVLARSGAAEAVEVLAGSIADDGALVPDDLANILGVRPGDRIRLGSGPPVEVAAVYRDLWTAPLEPYWAEAPVDVVPRFQRVFNQPSFQLVIVDDATLAQIGSVGRVRWDAALDERPTTWRGLRAINDQYDAVASALVRRGPLSDAYRAIAQDPEAPPSTFTSLGDTEERARTLIEELSRPVAATTIGGVVAGLLMSSLGSIMLVRRHRRDHRLLAADGDGWWRFVGRALVQCGPPASIGGACGVVGAWTLIRTLGPSGRADLDVVPWGSVLAVTAGALVIASIATAALAVRLTDALDVSVGAFGPTWVSLLLGTVAAMWIAVGQDDRRGGDALVIAFPLVGVVAGVVSITMLWRYVLRRLRRTGSRLPTPAFLAWRALTASEQGAVGLTAAMGIAAGLAVLSISFVQSIDRAIEIKAATAVGSVSRLHTADRIADDEAPPGSTVIRSLTTRAGRTSVEVIAIDPDTFADAVVWPDAFGSSADSVVDVLAAPASPDGAPPESVPALVVEGTGVPSRGEFGLQRTFPYDVVGSVRSFPLASSSRGTLIVRADVLDEVALGRWSIDAAQVGTTEVLAAEALGQEVDFDSPLLAYRNSVVSRQPASALAAYAADRGLRRAEVIALGDVTGDVESRSTRWAFDHVSLLGLVGGIVAFGALALYLAERRRDRSVATVMTEQLGISRATNVLAAVVELVGLLSIAVGAGVASALVTASHAFPAFEPDPEMPPSVGLAVERADLALLVGGAAVAVSVLAAVAQRRASSASRAEVLRG
jgi:putative ABC transport system permease protein